MIRASRKSRLRAGVWIVLVVAVLVAGQGEALAARDICVSAEVPEPILLPDGSWHPAGVLKLCLRGDYSPGAAFHETYVNHMPIGLFLSHQCVRDCKIITGHVEAPLSIMVAWTLTRYRRSTSQCPLAHRCTRHLQIIPL